MFKNKRGISLTTMVMTVIIMFIIMGTLAYSAVDSVKIRRLNKLYNDLRQLDDAISVYYLRNGELPIDTSKSAIIANEGKTKTQLENDKIAFVLNSDASSVDGQDSFINPNDYAYDNDLTNPTNSGYKAIYYFIKLDLLDNLSLNYKDNEFIVNKNSHTVYYQTGLTVDGVTYNYLPLTYKDTHYNENHPVKSITLRSLPGIIDESNIYYAYNLENFNLKNLLVFNNSDSLVDGSGKPRTVTFSEETTTDYYSIDSNTGILTRSSSDLSKIDANNSSSAKVSITNYDANYEDKELSFNIYTSAIGIEPTTINMLVNNIKEFDVKKYGYIRDKQIADESIISKDSDIVLNGILSSSSASTDKISFTSGSKAGSTEVTLQAGNYGKPQSKVTINVYDFKICKTSDASNTNINKLDFTGLGNDKNISLKLNAEGPSGFAFGENNNSVEWKIVNLDGTEVSESDKIVTLVEDSDNTKITITPKKVGKTYLKCIIKVQGDILKEIQIPIVVSSIESADANTVIANDNVNFSINGTKKAKIKYTFGEIPEGTITYETPTVTPSEGFSVTSNNDNTFTITYSGESETVATVLFVVKNGDIKYEDTVTITVSS